MAKIPRADKNVMQRGARRLPGGRVPRADCLECCVACGLRKFGVYFGFGSDWAPPLGPGPTDPPGTLPGPLPRPKGKQVGLHVRESPLRVCHLSRGGTPGVGYKSKRTGGSLGRFVKSPSGGGLGRLAEIPKGEGVGVLGVCQRSTRG